MENNPLNPARPQPSQIQSKWAVPYGITTETDKDGSIAYKCKIVNSPTLFDHDLIAAFNAAGVSVDEYSADIHAAICHRIRLQRAAEYPPVEDYLDGVAKNDEDQIAAYKAACLAVKEKYPFPTSPDEQ